MLVKNRIVQLPHGVYFAEPGAQKATVRHVDYYARRAEGGVGYIVMESSVVSPDGRGRGSLTLASASGAIEDYRAIADAVHDRGAVVGGQITHFGNQAVSCLTRRPLVAPSTLGDPLVREQPRAMDAADFARVRRDFATSASNFAAAGFDAVEVKLAHDGLLRQFMSPLGNARGDEYGGSTSNRLRFPLEVIESVRAAVGGSVAVGVRLVVDEHVDGGYALAEGLAFARLIGSSGLVDYISSDVGVSASIHWVIPPMGVTEGYAEEAFAGIASESGLPVIACGQISSPEYAERILREGKAAAIGMARQLLADPDWAEKALSGMPERIRPCTRCNQLCIRNSIAFVSTSCTLNPLAGHGERIPTAGPNRGGTVVVVGAGPAGMEAARVAAERAQRVVLFEASDRLGGRLDLAARTGRRDGWRPYLDWLERELARLGVEVERGRRAGPDDVLSYTPDHVIVATGSAPAERAATGVLDVDGFASGERRFERLGLADTGVAGMELWSSAVEALDRGAVEVTIVTPLPTVGADLDAPTFLRLRDELGRHDVRALTEHVVSRLGATWLIARDVHSGRETHVEGDAIVASGPRRSTGDELVRELIKNVPVTAVGDALVPRDVSAAIREGQEAAAALERRTWRTGQARTRSRSW
jgi:2,4-dienoyl-CoA reductase (NADPH2)